MRYLTLGEVVELHQRLLQATGGAAGIRDSGAEINPQTQRAGLRAFLTLTRSMELVARVPILTSDHLP